MFRPALSRALQTSARRALVGASVGATAYAAYTYGPDREQLAQLAAAFSGLRADAADRIAVKMDAAASAPVAATALGVDPATSVAHPATLLIASAPELSLVGVGVRTVSFLSFKVYSAAFYANDVVLKRLGSLPGWAGFAPENLAGAEGEKYVQALLDAPTAVAVRIVPVRNTDFGHLRDGFTRTLLARAKDARKRGDLSADDDERVATGIQLLKAVFPAGSVPKGEALVLIRTTEGNLVFEHKGRVLGAVHDRWVADNLVLAYFAKDPISPPLKQSAAEGFERYLKK